VKRLHIIGRKNSGKTTLMVELVERFTALGYVVGTIKHTHHQHELDTPGKDSFRHRQAGSRAVGILSPGMNAVFWPAQAGEDVSDRFGRFDDLMKMCDLVLVEGHSQTTALKIEVWRAAVDSQPLASADASVAAIISDDPISASEIANLPQVWPRADVGRLVKNIRELLSLPSPAGDAS